MLMQSKDTCSWTGISGNWKHRRWSLQESSAWEQLKTVFDENLEQTHSVLDGSLFLAMPSEKETLWDLLSGCWPSKYSCQLHSIGGKPHLKSLHRRWATVWGQAWWPWSQQLPLKTAVLFRTIPCYLQLLKTSVFAFTRCPVKFSFLPYWHFTNGKKKKIKLQKLPFQAIQRNSFYHFVVSLNSSRSERVSSSPQWTEQVALCLINYYYLFLIPKNEWRKREGSGFRLCKNHSVRELDQPKSNKALLRLQQHKLAKWWLCFWIWWGIA